MQNFYLQSYLSKSASSTTTPQWWVSSIWCMWTSLFIGAKSEHADINHCQSHKCMYSVKLKSSLVKVGACSGPASCGQVASTDQMRGDTFTEWWWETVTLRKNTYIHIVLVSRLIPFVLALEKIHMQCLKPAWQNVL